jgi:hypothetical protein
MSRDAHVEAQPGAAQSGLQAGIDGKQVVVEAWAFLSSRRDHQQPATASQLRASCHQIVV